MTTTFGSAKWQGGIKDGKGAISTRSGALKDYPYGFASRFEGKPGSNPEELIGAAHAGCFTMALTAQLSRAGFAPTQIHTSATVALEKIGEAFAITRIELDTAAQMPDIDDATFQKHWHCNQTERFSSADCSQVSAASPTSGWHG